jgi:hypothetical protein
MKLFSKDVIYYETPFVKLNTFSELKHELQTIENQSDISLNLELFSSVDGKHAVIWHLNYTNSLNKNKQLSGTYLIKLDNDGLCTYFHHTGEPKT